MIGVRLAKPDDSKEIFEWRNNSLTLTMSHSSDRVEWEEHCKWFESTLINPNRFLLICEDKLKAKIAVVRFDLENDIATVSMNLSPYQRGKGYAKPCLNSSIEFIANKVKSLSAFLAEIKTTNLPSQKSFIGVGFELYKEANGVGFYKKITW